VFKHYVGSAQKTAPPFRRHSIGVACSAAAAVEVVFIAFVIYLY
jgi:hypothetical protein